MKPNQKNRYNGRHNNRNTRSMIMRNTVMESTGPMGKIHGTALQLSEKYQAYAKDYLIQNDVVMAQMCMQYADHYIRLQNIAIANEQSLRPQNNNEQRQKQVAEKTELQPTISENIEETQELNTKEESVSETKTDEVVETETPSEPKEKKVKSAKKQANRKVTKKKEKEVDEELEIKAEDVLGCDLSVPIAVMQENNEVPVKTKRVTSRQQVKQAISQ